MFGPIITVVKFSTPTGVSFVVHREVHKQVEGYRLSGPVVSSLGSVSRRTEVISTLSEELKEIFE